MKSFKKEKNVILEERDRDKTNRITGRERDRWTDEKGI